MINELRSEQPIAQLLSAMRAELGFWFQLRSASGAESLPSGLGVLQRGVHSGSFREEGLIASRAGPCGRPCSLLFAYEYSTRAFGRMRIRGRDYGGAGDHFAFLLEAMHVPAAPSAQINER